MLPETGFLRDTLIFTRGGKKKPGFSPREWVRSFEMMVRSRSSWQETGFLPDLECFTQGGKKKPGFCTRGGCGQNQSI
ncbi:MAG: hypothetical protein EBE86_031105 [Hormoscilla sp. GUM202]|nr:hypothetical protein [Hormoscilla sp. GUM202]